MAVKLKVNENMIITGMAIKKEDNFWYALKGTLLIEKRSNHEQ
jgi:hypothetical protein